MTETVVIPDIHGRRFWKEAVALHPSADIIFLGDYLDPYPTEGISPEDAISNLIEIIELAKESPSCQLLMGNHDLHYLCNFGEDCRLDYLNSAEIHFLLMDNLWLFKLAELKNFDGKKVIFSHAPILTPWIETVGETTDREFLVTHINSMMRLIRKQPWTVEEYLGQISPYRGGDAPCGSPVWADIREISDNILPTVDYSIFGHTQQFTDPVITDRWACLDCRRPFLLSPDLTLHPILPV